MEPTGVSGHEPLREDDQLRPMAPGLTPLTGASPAPPLDVQLPWAAVPVPGFAVAFWIAYRNKDRFRGRRGWQGKLGVFLDAIDLVRTMFRHPVRHGSGPAGMILFWLADMFGAWCAMAAFGFQMNGAAFVLGFATGAVFTRRTGPLAGAGILMPCLPVTIWYSGAPWGAAITGAFVVRFLRFWLPLPSAVASLPTLRAITGTRTGQDTPGEDAGGEPAMEQAG